MGFIRSNARFRNLRRRGRVLLAAGVLIALALLFWLVFSQLTSPGNAASSGTSAGQAAHVDVAQMVREKLVTPDMISAEKDAMMEACHRMLSGVGNDEECRRHYEAFKLMTGSTSSWDPFNLPTPQPPPPNAPTPVPTLPATVGPSVLITAAWGTNLGIVSLPMEYGGEYLLACYTMTADDKYLACVAHPKEADPYNNPPPVKVVLVNVLTQMVTEIHTLPDNRKQAFNLLAGDRWIAWIEAAEMDNRDAELYAYDRADGTLRVLAASRANSQISTILGPSGGRLDGDNITWVESLTGGSGPGAWVFKRADMTTGQIEALPEEPPSYISSTYSTWLKIRESGPQVTTFSIDVQDMRTGDRWTMREPYTPNYAIDDDTVVWARSTGELVLTDVHETTQEVIFKGIPNDITGITLNSRLVAWSSAWDVQVWDRAQKRPVRLPGARLTAIFGDRLVWHVYPGGLGPNSPGSIYVLDTSQLPR